MMGVLCSFKYYCFYFLASFEGKIWNCLCQFGLKGPSLVTFSKTWDFKTLCYKILIPKNYFRSVTQFQTPKLP